MKKKFNGIKIFGSLFAVSGVGVLGFFAYKKITPYIKQKIASSKVEDTKFNSDFFNNLDMSSTLNALSDLVQADPEKQAEAIKAFSQNVLPDSNVENKIETIPETSVTEQDPSKQLKENAEQNGQNIKPQVKQNVSSTDDEDFSEVDDLSSEDQKEINEMFKNEEELDTDETIKKIFSIFDEKLLSSIDDDKKTEYNNLKTNSLSSVVQQ